MCASKVISFPRKNPPRPTKTLEAAEVFEFMMLNFEDSNYKRHVAMIINNDSRALSETAIWLLERRGYNESIIPKMSTNKEVCFEAYA